jgi:nitrite reductase/ring-hydroxylating ferredoxin subunit
MSKQQKDSDDLLRVGAGTPMGEMMRQYWIPAIMSSELERDGAPLRLMLLGEKLIAFRDSSGRVGVMDHRCPHRCASLFLGRNEENGIRCIYHGWKYDADGNCVDMPNAPPHQDFRTRSGPKPIGSPSAMRSFGSIWAPARSRRHCRRSRRRYCRRPNCRSRLCSVSATGCRRSKATSTPRISAFSTLAACSPRKWHPTA